MTREEEITFLQNKKREVADEKVKPVVNSIFDIYHQGVEAGVEIGKHGVIHTACIWLANTMDALRNSSIPTEEYINDFRKELEK